jgi:hypothetical protein
MQDLKLWPPVYRFVPEALPIVWSMNRKVAASAFRFASRVCSGVFPMKLWLMPGSTMSSCFTPADFNFSAISSVWWYGTVVSSVPTSYCSSDIPSRPRHSPWPTAKPARRENRQTARCGASRRPSSHRHGCTSPGESQSLPWMLRASTSAQRRVERERHAIRSHDWL